MRVKSLVPQQILGNGKSNVVLYVDDKNSQDIMSIIIQNQAKFKKCFAVMNSGGYDTEHYRREKTSKKTKNITAIKIKVSKGANYRIYCQEEIVNHVKEVTMCKSHKKTSEKNDTKTNRIIEAVADYQY